MNLRSFVILMLFQFATLKNAAVDQNKCGYKLLDDTKLVPDSAFSASSSFEHSNSEKQLDLSARAARESYDKDSQESAWCPKYKVGAELTEYLEIDLGRLDVIRFAQTRGRFAQGAGKEFTPHYKIKYRREITEKWRLYKKFDSKTGLAELLKGPNDPFLDAYETLDPPIITRWIRIYPFCYDTMRVCMKLQLFGCKFESSLLEYRIPQGSERTTELFGSQSIISPVIKPFQDSSYDGYSHGDILNGGLGRLTDNKSGGNLIINPIEAQYFVGWNRRNMHIYTDEAVTLVFRFDSIRNFSYIILNGFENGSMKISRPAKMEARFNVQNDIFIDKTAMVFTLPIPVSDTLREVSPWPKFSFKNQIGKFVQLKLFFHSDWILLSEIDFLSEKAKMVEYEIEIIVPKIKQVTNHPSDSGNQQSHKNSPFAMDIVYILLILIFILVTTVIGCGAIWIIIRYFRKKKNDIKKQGLSIYSQKPFDMLSMPLNGQAGTSHITNQYIGQYTQGTLRDERDQPISFGPDSRLFKKNSNPQNYIPTSKLPYHGNENNIYTSIPGSDNDSSISTDYMASSGANSSHPYVQTFPGTCTNTDYISNTPHIFTNPLQKFYETPQRLCQPPKYEMHSHDGDLFINQNNLRYSNTTSNTQSLSGSNGYQPIEYSKSSIDRSCPISYHNSPVMNDHFDK